MNSRSLSNPDVGQLTASPAGRATGVNEGVTNTTPTEIA